MLKKKFGVKLVLDHVIGGTNLGELDLFWMRRKIALVSQEPVLFATTIAGNIAYGRDATLEEVGTLLYQGVFHIKYLYIGCLNYTLQISNRNLWHNAHLKA